MLRADAGEFQKSLVKREKELARVRVKYDLDPDLKGMVERIARQEDTSASQMAQLLLGWAVGMYAKEDAKLLASIQYSKVPAKTNRFGWNMRIPRRWGELFARFLREDGSIGDY